MGYRWTDRGSARGRRQCVMAHTSSQTPYSIATPGLPSPEHPRAATECPRRTRLRTEEIGGARSKICFWRNRTEGIHMDYGYLRREGSGAQQPRAPPPEPAVVTVSFALGFELRRAWRALEKTGKHGPGCFDLRRAFLPIVFSTLGGVGAQEGLDFINGLFTASFVREKIGGGSGQETSMRKSRLLQSLHAANVRGSCAACVALTDPSPPPFTPPPPAAPPHY